MRYIGMDVHREFARLVVVEDGVVRDEGRIGVTPEALREWAAALRGDDQVALLIRPFWLRSRLPTQLRRGYGWLAI